MNRERCRHLGGLLFFFLGIDDWDDWDMGEDFWDCYGYGYGYE